jgi:RHS repeat-associated protein
VTYTYDAADRLLTISDGTTFTWDANGNMTGKGSATYTFNVLDRLTQVVSGTTTVQFTYDGDGVRLSKTVNGMATDYVQDIAAPLPVVLVETTAGQTAQYVYGNDLLAQVDPAGNPLFYHTDGLGSTRALSNLAGHRTDTYNYDVFGAVRSHAGSASQPFTFTGEQIDGGLGLVFLRARYYDPAVGRFISRDPWPALADAPQSLNRYVYAANNPVNVVDPSGAFNLKQIGQGAWDLLGGAGTMAKSIALGGIASTLCATGVGCVAGAPVAVYAANEAFVGGQKIGAGLLEIGKGVVKSGEAPVERYEAIDPLAYGLEEAGARAASRLGYRPEEGRLAGQALKLAIDAGISLALALTPGSTPDTVAYNLWHGGVVDSLYRSRIYADIMSNPLTQIIGSLSHVSRLQGLWRGLGTPWQPIPVYAPGDPLFQQTQSSAPSRGK